MMIEYYEDITLHQASRLGPFMLTEQNILDFATMWDPLPMHSDPEFARATGRGQIIASGFQLLAVCQKLMIEQKPMAILIGLGLEEVHFLAPGKPNDLLFLEIKTFAKRESRSNPDAGIITHSFRLLKQKDETVLTYKGTAMIEKRNKTIR